MYEHRPVLLEETLDALAVRDGGAYVDGTFGRGGHAAAILDRLGEGGRLTVVDRDPEALAWARERFGDDPRVTAVQGNFGDLGLLVRGEAPEAGFDGILLDLGVSSPQLDDPSRGFSFLRDGPLDMRMDTERGETAADWLDRAHEQEIDEVIRKFGEDRFHRRIARAIVRAREETPLTRTGRLAEVVAAAVPRSEPGKHPATRTFQAIRMHINGELEAVERALDASLELLADGGRLAVISFHSLEDRMVKRFIRRHSTVAEPWRGLPDIPPEYLPKLRAVGKARRAGEEELDANPRSRSAVLRAAERCR